MPDLARWNLTVPPDLDKGLRTFLAGRGGRKGDLSRFVADAVSRELLRRTMDEVGSRNADLSEDEALLLIDEALAEIHDDAWGSVRG